MSETKTKEITVGCGACGCTGIYRGMAEPKGVGVVCLNCNGEGHLKITITEWDGHRKTRDEVFVGMAQQ